MNWNTTRICIIFGLTIACLTPQVESAETDPTIQYLVTTPMTLMDKGVFEIKSKMTAANTNPYLISIKPNVLSAYAIHHSVYVVPLRIELAVHVYPEQAISNGRATCHALLRYAEDVLGFQSKDSRPEYMAESLAKIFGHNGYTPVGHPPNLGARLKGLFTVNAHVIPSSGDKHFCYSVGGGPIQDGKLP